MYVYNVVNANECQKADWVNHKTICPLQDKREAIKQTDVFINFCYGFQYILNFQQKLGYLVVAYFASKMGKILKIRKVWQPCLAMHGR